MHRTKINKQPTSGFYRLPRYLQRQYIRRAQELGVDPVALFEYEQQRMLDRKVNVPVCCEQNLDNCMETAHKADHMPFLEGADEMHKRQKVIINGCERWISFSSTQELVDLIQQECGATLPKKDAPMLVEDYMLNWFETYKRPRLDPHSAGGEISLIHKHILPVMGKKALNNVCTADVQKAVGAVQSASMGKKVKSVINQCFAAAIADELYTHPNPAADKRIALPTKVDKRLPLDKADLAKVIELIPTLPLRQAQLLSILVMTGCRRGEALAAHWEDIDWERKTIHFQRTVRFRDNRPEISTKMKTPSANRMVSLWESLIPYLGTPQKSGLIINDQGRPLTERQYNNCWNALQKRLAEAGVQNAFTAHQLRHTFATVAANSGEIPLKVLQGILGHANFQTTMNTYASLDADEMLAGGGKISEKYAEITQKVAAKIV